MKWENKAVLVTGGGGFIGSHLVERLLSLKAKVTVFVRYNSRGDFGFIDKIDTETIEGLEVVQGNLQDSDAIRSVVKGRDIVFHLGALISIPYSYVHPRENVDTNVIGTLNVISASRDFNVERIVHTSTSEVYGTAQYVPIDEKHPINPQSPYAASKASADYLARAFYYSFDTPIVIVRPFNTYGPRQSARAVIPTIITQALTQNEIRLGNTKPTRDFTFVTDTVDGFIKAAEKEDIVGETINLGTNSEISIGDLANKITGIIGRDVKLLVDEDRLRPGKSEVERLLVDNSKAKKLLNWEPTVPLGDGLRATISWLRENISLYKPGKYNI